MTKLVEHYASIRDEFDYDRPDVDVGTLPAPLMDRAFSATTDAEALQQAGDQDTKFVASAGLTGTPHVGTVAQMFAVKRLNEAGFDTEFLVADYEKYAGSGRDLDIVRDLAEDYATFLDRIGYEGGVRTQYDAEDVMHTAFRLAPYWETDPEFEINVDLTPWEEELKAAYESDQVELADASGGTEFGRNLTGLLCLADFMHPSLAEGYDQAVFVLGVDEHALYEYNDYFVEDSPFDPAFEGLFTRMVPGLNGYPKMSKTIPGSGIKMDMPPERVRRLVRKAADDSGGDHDSDSTHSADSAVYQMMCLVSEYDAERLAELERAYRESGERWNAACEAYADYLADLASKWPGNGHDAD